MISFAIFIPMTIMEGVMEITKELISRLMFKHKLRARRRRHFV